MKRIYYGSSYYIIEVNGKFFERREGFIIIGLIILSMGMEVNKIIEE